MDMNNNMNDNNNAKKDNGLTNLMNDTNFNDTNDSNANNNNNDDDAKMKEDKTTNITNSLTNNIILEELYLGHNNIEEIKGIETLTKLNTLDFSSNKIKKIENLNHLSLLEEFWMSGNLVETYDDIEQLANCKNIKTVYLEHNPISKDFEYRKKTAAMLPSLKQIDSTPCRRR